MVKTSSIVITARKSSMAPIVCALKVTCCLPELGSGRIRPRSKRILREQISLMMWGATGDSANRFLAVVLAFCSLSLSVYFVRIKGMRKKAFGLPLMYLRYGKKNSTKDMQTGDDQQTLSAT